MNCNHKQLESVAAAENGMCPLCLLAAWQEKDAQVAALTAALEDIAHGPVGSWNEPQHAAEVIKFIMRVASDALKGGAK